MEHKEKSVKNTLITLASVIVAVIIIKLPFQIWNSQIKKSSDSQPNNVLNNERITNIDYEDVYQIQVENTIKKFIDYCNSGKTENAYNMLTDKCKEEMYPSLQNFVDNYYTNKFSTPKNYIITKVNAYVYKVDLKESSVNTGKISEDSIQDFIIVQDNKLNINEDIEKDLNVN